MRHGNKIKKLGRTQAHRKATLSSLSSALIVHKRITTTLAKAKALRMYVEPIINRAKDPSTANRRQVFRRLNDKEATKALFNDVAGVLGERPGGYTRVVKLGLRAGDAAEMAVIELVDFNDVRPEGGAATRRKTRRSRARRGGAGAAEGGDQPQAGKAPAEAVKNVAAKAPAKGAAPAAGAPPAGAPADPADTVDDPNPALAEGTPALPNTHPESAQDQHPDAPQGGTAGHGPPPPESTQENVGRGAQDRG
jgi:large subunit ribosomal protein L17